MNTLNIQQQSYTKHFGIEFQNLPDGAPFPKINAGLNIWKKHKLFAERGMIPNCDPAECLLYAAKALFPGFIVTPWAETMIHDLTHHKEVIFMGPASSGKSHIMALYAICLYICDPANTAVILCSTTREDLKSRAWSPLKEFVAQLRSHPDFSGAGIRVLENEYCVCSEPDARVPETMTKRAAIRGIALAEGRVQGTHVSGEYSTTALMVDELSTVENIPALLTGIMNISTGTDYRFCAAANPDGWSTDVSSKFFMPPEGPQSVTPETGSWISRSGYFIRHFDGEKSPAILQPGMAKTWHFLLNQETLTRNLERCNGDRNSTDYMKMIRGYPTLGSSGDAVVLDPIVAARERVTEPLHAPVFGGRDTVGKASGVDPAWSPAGDAAVMATINVFRQEGKVFLDYTQGVHRLPIVSSDTKPILTQLRDGVIARMNADGGPTIERLAVDSSGNQALGDELTTFVGPGCLAVNSSKIASDTFLRAGETQEALKAKARIADRGTEAWFVLAEFARAGMIRGLPIDVKNDLCNRRYQRKADGSDLPKMRLESKDDFCKRVGHGSPNEADACALAALAVKERMGIMPYGSVPTQNPEGVIPEAYQRLKDNGMVGTYMAFDKGNDGDNSFDEIGAFED